MSQNFLFFINFLLYFTLLLVLTRKKAFKIGVAIVTIYSLVAFGGLFFSIEGTFGRNLSLEIWPFIYIFLIFVIMVLPLCRSNFILIDRINLDGYKGLNVICSLYVVISFLYIVTLSSSVISAIQSGEWLAIYKEFRSEDAVFYTSFYERVLINIVTYFRIPVLFYSFLVFAKKIQYRYKWFSITLPMINSVVWAIYTASRTEFVMIFFLYFISFIICTNYLSKSVKTKFKIMFLSLLLFAGIIIVAISFSRFGEGESYWISDYFGDSFRVAHNTVLYTYESSYGSRFFYEVYSASGVPIRDFKCTIDEGSAFHTLIGMRYTDFGFIGTIIYAIIGFAFVNKIVNKRSISLGDVYIILYYSAALFIGVFYDSTTAYSWIIVIVISFVLTYISRNKIHVKA